MPGKSLKPPPLPIEVAYRVVRLSSTHGRMIMVMSGIFALIAALGHQAPATIAGLLAVGAGACEWHGSQELRTGRGPGINWMKTGELCLMVIVIGYAGWMMAHFNEAEFVSRMPDWYMERLEADFAAAGLGESDMPAFFHTVNVLSYAVIAVLTFVYQGGLALYYHSKRQAIAAALPDLARG